MRGLPGRGPLTLALSPAAPARGPARTRGRGPLLAATACALWALAQRPCSAHAAENDLYVVLHYTVDASVRGCGEEEEFRRSVAHRIGYDPFREDASIDVRVRVGGAANAVDGHVEWRKANGLLMGERRFVAKDGNCAKLLTEMSFAVGLQIELLRPKPPVAAATGSAPTAATVVAPPLSSSTTASPAANAPAPSLPSATTFLPPTPLPTTTSKPDVSEKLSAEKEPREKVIEGVEPPTDTEPSRWSMWVGLGPSLAWRISPTLTGDGRLFLGVRHNDLSLEIGAEASYPSTERQWDGSGLRQSLIGGALALCGHYDAWSACALGRASQVRVNGLGVDEPRSPTGFVAQAGVRFAATLALGGPWFFAAHLDGLGLLTQCKVVLNQATLWEMPRLGTLAGIDLTARFR